MGFGAILTTGDDLSPLAEDVMRWIVEVRVEQELSKPTIYAVRFEDDLCEGNPVVAGRPELQANQVLGIFVSSDDGYECLVHGPITRLRTSSMVGGTGSWVEVHGQDRRVEMDRIGVQATWTGKASEAAQRVIEAYGYEADCEETRKEYSDGQNALNQRGTDLAFLEDIARKNNLELWLSYETSGRPDAFSVSTTVNVRSSPTRTSAPGLSLPLAPPVLRAPGGKVLRVQPPPDACASVTRFDTHVDFERPGAARGFAQTVDNGETSEQTTSPTDPTLGEERADIVAVDGVERTALAPPVTDPDEHYLAQEALLTEAAWFVQVDCSATLEQLGFPPQPHQIVDVQYAGERLSGPYQVMKATHIINAADSYVDFKIRANGLRETQGVVP
ncbi:hypothetical protein [Nocardia beijingensis]|uniref:hypothetical protein n=1 Tax=Nocardia beijingensis TaxID=95162 RepID=UPI00082997D0|nr:hypothetical protein [Nocardia beijingensis]